MGTIKSMFEEVTMEEAEIIAEAKRRHFKFIEKMTEIMKEYGVEITGNAEGEITIETNFKGESTLSEPAPAYPGRYHGCTVEAMENEMTYKEWNTPEAIHIFKNHERWAREARERRERVFAETPTTFESEE